MANNREISQFAGLVTVNDSTNQVSIGASLQLTGGGHIGIGSDVTTNSIACRFTSKCFFYIIKAFFKRYFICLLYTSPSPRDVEESRMPSSA